MYNYRINKFKSQFYEDRLIFSTASQCVNLGGYGGYEYAGDHEDAEDKHANTWVDCQSSTDSPTDNTLEIQRI